MDRRLQCFIDGNCLCIVRDDFKNIQESDVIFIELHPSRIEKIKALEQSMGELKEVKEQ